MGLIPSIHHFPGSKTMGQWPRTTGWTSRPEATFINLASAKATFVKVKSNRVNYKSKLDRRHNIYKFWAATAELPWQGSCPTVQPRWARARDQHRWPYCPADPRACHDPNGHWSRLPWLHSLGDPHLITHWRQPLVQRPALHTTTTSIPLLHSTPYARDLHQPCYWSFITRTSTASICCHFNFLVPFSTQLTQSDWWFVFWPPTLMVSPQSRPLTKV